MRTIVILPLLFAATFAVPASEVSPAIVGGVNAIPGEFPFIVSLQWIVLGLPIHICGGAIISSLWVLSAGHCITEIPSLGRIEILAGKHNLALTEASEVRLRIVLTILHPGHTPGPQVAPDDLVLLRVAAPFIFNARIRAIRLPTPRSIPTTALTLAGWGGTNPDGSSTLNILQKAVLPTISLEECRSAWNSLGVNGNLVDDTNFCTGPLTGGVSSCSGDNGGPLVYGSAPNEVLEGIVSWGTTPCGRVGAPSGVFKRVSAYYSWIEEQTGITF